MSSDGDTFPFKLSEISLEKLALMQYVSKFWRECNIMKAVEDKSWMFYSRFRNRPSADNFKILTNEISEKIIQLKHRPLIRKAKLLIVPIGLHLCEWITENKIYINHLNREDFLNSVRWTHQGFIDKKLSTDLWLRKVNDPIFFERACYFCIENQVKMLWEKLPLYLKIALYDLNRQEYVMVKYWVLERTNHLQELILRHRNLIFMIDGNEVRFENQNINVSMIKFSLITANSHAFKYFFSKLSRDEQIENAYYCMQKIILYGRNLERYPLEYIKMFFFLHPQLTSEQRELFFRNDPKFHLYATTVFWQYQNLLPNLIIELKEGFTFEMFYTVIVIIAVHIRLGRYIEPGLANDVWLNSSESLRNGLLEKVTKGSPLLILFDGGMLEINKCILKTTAVQKNELYSFFEI